MGIRFRKYITIIPGVKINLSKSGVSATIGHKGASVNISKNGTFVNAGIPGTGIFMRERISETRTGKTRTIPSVADITETMHEEADRLNEKVAKDLVIWEHLPHPMQYPVFQIAPFYLEKPRPLPVPMLPIFVGVVITIIIFVLANLYTNSTEWAVVASAIPACVGMFFSFKQKAQIDYQNSTKWQSEYDKWDAEQKNLEEDFVAIIDCGKEEPEEALSVAFENIRWPYDTHISYQVVNDVALVDIDLPEIEELPDSVYVVRGQGRDKEIDTKAKTKVKLYEEYARHIHGIGVVVAATVFSTLLHVNTIVLSAFSQRKSKQTAMTIDEYLYSAIITRDQWTSLFDSSRSWMYDDPIDRLEYFDIRRNMSSSYIFKPIKPFAGDDINGTVNCINARYGFRNYRWGCPSSDLEERKEYDNERPYIKIYEKTKENLQLGDIALLKIFYIFCLDRLMAVEIQSGLVNYENISQLLTHGLGEAEAGNSNLEELKWLNDKSLLLLSKTDEAVILNISSHTEIDLMDKIDKKERGELPS